jgi:hypothetical protein
MAMHYDELLMSVSQAALTDWCGPQAHEEHLQCCASSWRSAHWRHDVHDLPLKALNHCIVTRLTTEAAGCTIRHRTLPLIIMAWAGHRHHCHQPYVNSGPNDSELSPPVQSMHKVAASSPPLPLPPTPGPLQTSLLALTRLY